ncbi:MAG: sel1 repeat family protein [Bradyrhizobiaceae bacterium]|nr:sel1 repeat family protein [Bradyrhizobiaceae bacterium]
MGRSELLALEEAAKRQGGNIAEICFKLGMFYSIGGSVPADKVAAHKWFNLAAARGNREAVNYRRELANEMSEGEIADAQRAAREWIVAAAY